MSQTILMVDDSNIMLKMGKVALEGAGYTVHCFNPMSAGLAAAASLAEALKHQTTPPDLILMDINMPELTGDQVVRLFRGTWDIPIPIHFFSDISEEELQRHVEETGANGYIRKAWGAEGLVRTVREILGGD